jgi:hypothetical protein
MSNKTQLQINNASLDGYIARINAAKDVAAALPEAGGSGGNVETCTITVTGSDIVIGYTDAYSQSQTSNIDGQYICKKDSLVAAFDGTYSTGLSVSGGEILVGDDMGGLCFYIKATDNIIISRRY